MAENTRRNSYELIEDSIATLIENVENKNRGYTNATDTEREEIVSALHTAKSYVETAKTYWKASLAPKAKAPKKIDPLEGLKAALAAGYITQEVYDAAAAKSDGLETSGASARDGSETDLGDAHVIQDSDEVLDTAGPASFDVREGGPTQVEDVSESGELPGGAADYSSEDDDLADFLNDIL